jgi:hypothetical protein
MQENLLLVRKTLDSVFTFSDDLSKLQYCVVDKDLFEVKANSRQHAIMIAYTLH